jgi:hypothetical protein
MIKIHFIYLYSKSFLKNLNNIYIFFKLMILLNFTANLYNKVFKLHYKYGIS